MVIILPLLVPLKRLLRGTQIRVPRRVYSLLYTVTSAFEGNEPNRVSIVC